MAKYATPKALADAARADAEASDYALVRKLADSGITVTAITPRCVIVQFDDREVVFTRPLQAWGEG